MTDLIIIGVLTLACVVTVVLIAAIYFKISRIDRNIEDIAYMTEQTLRLQINSPPQSEDQI